MKKIVLLISLHVIRKSRRIIFTRGIKSQYPKNTVSDFMQQFLFVEMKSSNVIPEKYREKPVINLRVATLYFTEFIFVNLFSSVISFRCVCLNTMK